MEAPWNIGEFYGQSYFCDPRGQIVAEGSRDQDELVVADLDMDKIREVRNTWQFFMIGVLMLTGRSSQIKAETRPVGSVFLNVNDTHPTGRVSALNSYV